MSIMLKKIQDWLLIIVVQTPGYERVPFLRLSVCKLDLYASRNS